MGIQNASARKLAVPDLTTTVLTLTITGVAADSALAGGTRLESRPPPDRGRGDARGCSDRCRARPPPIRGRPACHRADPHSRCCSNELARGAARGPVAPRHLTERPQNRRLAARDLSPDSPSCPILVRPCPSRPPISPSRSRRCTSRSARCTRCAASTSRCPRGTVLGMLGPNGAGKTTAVRVLTTLLRPDSGRVIIEGYDVVRDAAAVRRRIGLAGQATAIQLELTGRENLEIMGRLNHMPRSSVQGPCRRVARTLRDRGRRRSTREDVLGRHAATPRPRG